MLPARATPQAVTERFRPLFPSVLNRDRSFEPLISCVVRCFAAWTGPFSAYPWSWSWLMCEFGLRPQTSTKNRQETREIQSHLNESTTRLPHLLIVADLWSWAEVDCAAKGLLPLFDLRRWRSQIAVSCLYWKGKGPRWQGSLMFASSCLSTAIDGGTRPRLHLLTLGETTLVHRRTTVPSHPVCVGSPWEAGESGVEPTSFPGILVLLHATTLNPYAAPMV